MRGIKYRRGSRKWKRQINHGKNTEKFIIASPHNKAVVRNEAVQ